MKKTFLLFFLSVFTHPLFSQVSVAPLAGLLFSNYSGTGLSETKAKPGGNFGAIADIGITSNIYLQPGAMYMINEDISNSPAQIKTTIHSLEIPCDFIYRAGAGTAGRLFAGAGPYVARSLSGNMDYPHSTFYGGNHPLSFGSSASDAMKQNDFGVGIDAGIEPEQGFFIQLRYQHGLTNLGEGSMNVKSVSYGASIGYLIGTRGKKKPVQKDEGK